MVISDQKTTLRPWASSIVVTLLEGDVSVYKYCHRSSIGMRSYFRSQDLPKLYHWKIMTEPNGPVWLRL